MPRLGLVGYIVPRFGYYARGGGVGGRRPRGAGNWGLRVSLRARLALVMAGVMIGPAIAAWAVLGVLVPRAAARADTQSLTRADAAVGVFLTQQCRLLAQTARAVAGPLSGRVGVDALVARRAVAGVAAGGPDGVRALVVAGGVPVAGSPGAGTASGVAPLDLAQATCSAPLEGPTALLAESAPITDSSGREAARAVAYTALDGPALTRLRAALALDARLAVVRRVVAPVASTSTSVPTVSAICWARCSTVVGAVAAPARRRVPSAVPTSRRRSTSTSPMR